MPAAAVVPAAITAGGSLISSIIGSKASSNATKAQSTANAAALDYTKQKDAQTRADYERAYNEYLADRANWEQGRAELFQRYGLQAPNYSAPQPMQTSPLSAGPGGAVPRNAQYSPLAVDRLQRAALSGSTISDLLDKDVQGRKLAWNDWAKYNL